MAGKRAPDRRAGGRAAHLALHTIRRVARYAAPQSHLRPDVLPHHAPASHTSTRRTTSPPVPVESRVEPAHGGMHAVTRGCLAGSAVCLISREGQVQPCGYLPVSAGHVREQPFARIWQESPLFAALRCPENLTGKCGACPLPPDVPLGCRARAYAVHGDYLAEEPRTAATSRRLSASVKESAPMCDSSPLEQRVLNRIQRDFPLAPDPYQVLATSPGESADEIHTAVQSLYRRGVIRRIGASFAAAKLGYASTLAAARVPAEHLEHAPAMAGSFPEVTHNYQRDGAYNLWFTVIAAEQARIATILDAVRACPGVQAVADLPHGASSNCTSISSSPVKWQARTPAIPVRRQARTPAIPVIGLCSPSLTGVSLRARRRSRRGASPFAPSPPDAALSGNIAAAPARFSATGVLRRLGTVWPPVGRIQRQRDVRVGCTGRRGVARRRAIAATRPSPIATSAAPGGLAVRSLRHAPCPHARGLRRHRRAARCHSRHRCLSYLYSVREYKKTSLRYFVRKEKDLGSISRYE